MQPPTRKEGFVAGLPCGRWVVVGVYSAATKRRTTPTPLPENMQLGLLVEFYKAVSEC